MLNIYSESRYSYHWPIFEENIQLLTIQFVNCRLLKSSESLCTCVYDGYQSTSFSFCNVFGFILLWYQGNIIVKWVRDCYSLSLECHMQSKEKFWRVIGSQMYYTHWRLIHHECRVWVCWWEALTGGGKQVSGVTKRMHLFPYSLCFSATVTWETLLCGRTLYYVLPALGQQTVDWII